MSDDTGALKQIILLLLTRGGFGNGADQVSFTVTDEMLHRMPGPDRIQVDLQRNHAAFATTIYVTILSPEEALAQARQRIADIKGRMVEFRQAATEQGDEP